MPRQRYNTRPEVPAIERFHVRSGCREELVEITERLNEAVRAAGPNDGLCHVFVPHTTAGLLVNEHADPDVCTDMLAALDRIVPAECGYRHAEGNSPAHIKATLVGQSATLPVERGRLALGTWQGVFLAEFDGPRDRTIV